MMRLTTIHPARRTLARVVATASAAALLAATAGCAAHAQADKPALAAQAPMTPAAMPALPAPPRGGPAPKPLAGDDRPAVAQAVVSRFLTNPDGDIDGFLASDGTLVSVPPHLGSQLGAMVRPGDAVQVSGRRDAAGNLRAQRIVEQRSGRQLVDQAPPPGAPAMPPEARSARLARLSAQGKVAHVTTAPRGEADGVILADGTVIKLTPPVAQQFPDLVKVGADVVAQGYGTRNQYGTSLQVTAFGPPGNVQRIHERAPMLP